MEHYLFCEWMIWFACRVCGGGGEGVSWGFGGGGAGG